MCGALRDSVRVSRARWGNTGQTGAGSQLPEGLWGTRGSGKPLEGPSAALGQEDVAMAPCHTERRSLSCLEREPRRESEHGVRVRSRAHQCLRGPGRGGERGREWAAVGRARHGEQRPPPHVATWLPRGPSFQSFLQEEAHTPRASVRNCLTKTCWPLVQKLQNTTVKVEQTRGRAVAFPANSYTPVKAPRAETAPAAGPSATLRSRSSVSSPRCAVAPRRSLSVCIVPLPRPVRFGSLVQRPAGAESMHSAC